MRRRDVNVPPNLVPTPSILTFEPALIFGLPVRDAVGLDSTRPRVRSSVALASCVGLAARLDDAVGDRVRAAGERRRDDLARCSAGLRARSGAWTRAVDDLLLAFGSQPRTSTVSDLLDAAHARAEGDQRRRLAQLERRAVRRLPALRKCSLSSSTTNSKSCISAEPPGEVPVGLVALLEELVDDAGALGLPARPASPADLLDHVGGRHLLERRGSCAARLSGGSCRRRGRRSCSPARVNSGSTATIWPLKTLVVVGSSWPPNLISSSAPSSSGWRRCSRPSGRRCARAPSRAASGCRRP